MANLASDEIHTLSNPAMFLFSAKNSAGLFCCRSLFLAALTIVSVCYVVMGYIVVGQMSHPFGG